MSSPLRFVMNSGLLVPVGFKYSDSKFEEYMNSFSLFENIYVPLLSLYKFPMYFIFKYLNFCS